MRGSICVRCVILRTQSYNVRAKYLEKYDCVQFQTCQRVSSSRDWFIDWLYQRTASVCYRGVLKVDMNLGSVDVNQCATGGPLMFAETHRCPSVMQVSIHPSVCTFCALHILYGGRFHIQHPLLDPGQWLWTVLLLLLLLLGFLLLSDFQGTKTFSFRKFATDHN